MRSGLVDEPATTAEALGRPARGDAAAVGFAFPDTLPAATNGRTGDLTAGLTAGLAASDLTAGFREVEAPVFATDLAVLGKPPALAALDAATTFFDDFTAVAPDALRTGAAATLLAGLTAGLAATFSCSHFVHRHAFTPFFSFFCLFFFPSHSCAQACFLAPYLLSVCVGWTLNPKRPQNLTLNPQT